MFAGLMEPQLFSINVVPSASVIVRWSYLQSISNAVNCSSSISPCLTCTASFCSRLVWFDEDNGPVVQAVLTSLNSRIVNFYHFPTTHLRCHSLQGLQGKGLTSSVQTQWFCQGCMRIWQSQDICCSSIGRCHHHSSNHEQVGHKGGPARGEEEDILVKLKQASKAGGCASWTNTDCCWLGWLGGGDMTRETWLMWVIWVKWVTCHWTTGVTLR